MADARVVDGPGSAGYRDPMTGRVGDAAEVAAELARHMGPWALVRHEQVRGDARVATPTFGADSPLLTCLNALRRP